MQVLNHSGYLIKPLKAIQPLAVDELPSSVNLEDCCIKVRVKTFASLIKFVITLIKTTFQDLIKV